MSHWLVYWVLMLDNIQVFFTVILIAFIVINFIGLIAFGSGFADSDPGAYKFAKSLFKIFLLPLLLVSLLLCLMPNTKQMAAIYLIPKIVSNKSIQQLPPKLSKLALEYVNKKLNVEEKK